VIGEKQMGLNKQKGNMYGFITHTWNTIKGKCFHDCSYCYMKRFKNQRPVRFDEKELKTDLGENNFIFVGSSCDMFADNISEEWIYKTIDHCREFNNKYLFQTKNPKTYWTKIYPKNTILCMTLESNISYVNIMKNTPNIHYRVYYFGSLPLLKKMITIEPILDFDLKEFVEMIRSINPFQVNIGADSGHNNLPEPPKEKVIELIAELSKFTKVYQKDNLARLIKQG
jgi:hypothetical protein